MARRIRFKPLLQPTLLRDLLALDEQELLSMALMDDSADAFVPPSMNLRYEWRGFSFGSFWFGYYFSFGGRSSPRLGGRRAM